jgi:hypothetical protein
MASHKKDYTGFRQGKILVLSYADSLYGRPRWNCECACGKLFIITSQTLGKGQKSCGCIKKYCEHRVIKHGYSGSNVKSEYKSWQAMKTRCYYKNSIGYKNYGGRGIKVCDSWLNSFENFIKDMGDKPSLKHSLDRIDVNGDYSKENCKWSTSLEQSNNKRNNHNVFYGSEKISLSELSRRFNINKNSMRHRVLNQKLSIEEAVAKISVKQRGYNSFNLTTGATTFFEDINIAASYFLVTKSAVSTAAIKGFKVNKNYLIWR